MWRPASGFLALTLALAVCCGAAACTSESHSPHAAAPSTGHSEVAGSTSAAHGESLLATDAQNRRVLIAHVGDRLRVQLGSTYWRFASPSGSQLRVIGQPTAAPAASCVPGGGCGFVAQVYDVVAPGTTHVSASRTSCGEAMRCTGGESSFELTVIVH